MVLKKIFFSLFLITGYACFAVQLSPDVTNDTVEPYMLTIQNQTNDEFALIATRCECQFDEQTQIIAKKTFLTNKRLLANSTQHVALPPENDTAVIAWNVHTNKLWDNASNPWVIS